MTLELPILGEPVEIDGIFFETFISNPVIVAQKKGTVVKMFPEGRTVFDTGIRITNLSDQDYYFCHLVFSEVEIIDPNGGKLIAILTRSQIRYHSEVIRDDFTLVAAGSSVDLLLIASLGWTTNYHIKPARSKRRKHSLPYRFIYEDDNWKMFLNFFGISSDISTQLDNLIYGTYQIRFNYRLNTSVRERYLKGLFSKYSSVDITNIINKSWYGKTSTSFLEFRIEPNPLEIDIL